MASALYGIAAIYDLNCEHGRNKSAQHEDHHTMYAILRRIGSIRSRGVCEYLDKLSIEMKLSTLSSAVRQGSCGSNILVLSKRFLSFSNLHGYFQG